MLLKSKQKQLKSKTKSEYKQFSITENNWLNLIDLLKKILIPTETVHHLTNKKKYLIDLLKKNLMNFRIRKNKLILIILIYKYNTEGRSAKDFSDYRNPINLFINIGMVMETQEEYQKMKLTLNQIYSE